MEFGDRLVKIRKEHGYTRESLANELHISKYTLRNYELGVTEPGHTFLKQISDFFNISIDYLLGLTDEQEILKTCQLRKSEQDIIEKYRILDTHGREMVDFTLEKEYERSVALADQKADNIIKMDSHVQLKAAHARTDIEVTEEMNQHDDDIMNDDSEWE